MTDGSALAEAYPAPVARCREGGFPAFLGAYRDYWRGVVWRRDALSADVFKSARILLYDCISKHELTAEERGIADLAALELEHSRRMAACQSGLTAINDASAPSDFAAFFAAVDSLSRFRAGHPELLTPALKACESLHPDALGLEVRALCQGMGKIGCINGTWAVSQDGESGRATLSQSIVLRRHDHQTYLIFRGLPAEAEVTINGVRQKRDIRGSYASCRFVLPSFSTMRGYLELSISLPAKIPPSCIQQPWLTERM